MVTPFVQNVWNRLTDAYTKHDGSVRKVKLSMAGDRTRPGYLTDWGEVMINNDGLTKGADTLIIQVSRLHEELGMSALYRAGGSAVLTWPNGREVTLNRSDGLQYICWEDFTVLREELIKSHLNGRPNYALQEKKRLENEVMARRAVIGIEARSFGAGTASSTGASEKTKNASCLNHGAAVQRKSSHCGSSTRYLPNSSVFHKQFSTHQRGSPVDKECSCTHTRTGMQVCQDTGK